MIKLLLYKLFGLEEPPCASCELLRMQLEKCDSERKELLSRLLDKDKETVAQPDTKTLQPILPNFVPWRVRQQMLEAEDREKARVMRAKVEEMGIPDLEKELGVEEKKDA